MDVTVYLPLIAPAFAALAARPAADRLPPAAATWLLTAAALVLACSSSAVLGLLAFAALVLAALGFGFNPAPYDLILMGFVTVFTLVSVSLYLVDWVRHMSTIEVK